MLVEKQLKWRGTLIWFLIFVKITWASAWTSLSRRRGWLCAPAWGVGSWRWCRHRSEWRRRSPTRRAALGRRRRRLTRSRSSGDRSSPRNPSRWCRSARWRWRRWQRRRMDSFSRGCVRGRRQRQKLKTLRYENFILQSRFPFWFIDFSDCAHLTYSIIKSLWINMTQAVPCNLEF